MIIESKNITKNIIFLRKNGFRLYELDVEKPKKYIKKNLPYLTILAKDRKEISKTLDVNKSSKKEKLFKEKRKNLFLNNIISTEKNYFLKDYMKRKEVEIINNKINDRYQARKTFFSEKRVDNCRTCYFSKDITDNNIRTKKVPIVIKDIEGSLILMKKKRNEMYKKYLKEKLRLDLYENKYFTDFNEKLGIKKVNIKTDNLVKEQKGFMNNNSNFFSLKDFKEFTSTYNSMKRKHLKINIQ